MVKERDRVGHAVMHRIRVHRLEARGIHFSVVGGYGVARRDDRWSERASLMRRRFVPGNHRAELGVVHGANVATRITAQLRTEEAVELALVVRLVANLHEDVGGERGDAVGLRRIVEHEHRFADGDAVVDPIRIDLIVGVNAKTTVDLGARGSRRTIPKLDRRARQQRGAEIARVELFNCARRLDDDRALWTAQRTAGGKLRIVDFVGGNALTRTKDSGAHRRVVCLIRRRAPSGRQHLGVLLLGIETSCDDTAAAVVRDGRDVLSNVATNQDAFHAKYGGIVPEIASRRHVALLSAAVEDALARAGLSFDELDGIAVTSGPGLIGSLVVGVASAKAYAFALNKPLHAVNHLHGHVFAPFLERDEPPPYPFLTLLVSGGHSQLVAVESATRMRVLGRTHDDAAGEAYDKTARLLGLPYPGGPALDAMARRGDAAAYPFPRHRPAMVPSIFRSPASRRRCAYFLESDAGKRAKPEDVAASFQAAVVDVLIARLQAAYERAPYNAVTLSGGVRPIRRCRAPCAPGASATASAPYPPPKYCTIMPR